MKPDLKYRADHVSDSAEKWLRISNLYSAGTDSIALQIARNSSPVGYHLDGLRLCQKTRRGNYVAIKNLVVDGIDIRPVEGRERKA
jgi:hypothetical protein